MNKHVESISLKHLIHESKGQYMTQQYESYICAYVKQIKDSKEVIPQTRDKDKIKAYNTLMNLG